jgi:hypothetical protein
MFEQPLSFPCPSCKEIINDRAEKCKYCDAPIDKGVAQFAAEVQSKVNQAYSDASYLKTAAFTLWGLFAASLIPFIAFIYYGSVLTFCALIVLIIRWQIRFSDINTSDPDYQKARRAKNIALLLWAAMIPGFILREVFFFLLRSSFG